MFRRVSCLILCLCLSVLSACLSPDPAPDPGITPRIIVPEGGNDSSPAETAEPTPVPTPQPTPEATPEPTPEPTPVPDAADLTDSVELDVPGYDASWLIDRDYDTAAGIDGGSTITIRSDIPIGSLWIIWDEPPGEWTLNAGGTETVCGKDGIIHEFVPITTPSDTITIALEHYTVLCDIYVFSIGTVPDWVQTWHVPWDHADICVFPTHADDEDLFFGGILPYYAGELGLKVQVIYMTNHWNEQPRPHELLFGLWTAGDIAYPVISDFNDVYADNLDEAISIYGTEDFIEFQVEMLRRFKPSVIVCHAENGEYGHGVHMLNTYCMETAVLSAADPDQYPDSASKYGVWDTPKMYIHLYGDDPLVMDWHIPLERFNGMTALEVAQEAYKCHVSQQQWAFAVSEDGYGDCRLFGLYRSTVGEDEVRNDLMEHIDSRY